MRKRRPRRPFCPTITLAQNVTDTMRKHRVWPGLDWIGGADAFGWRVESAADVDQARQIKFDALNQGSKTQPSRLPPQ